MSLVLVEEVLVGLDEVKDALDKAVLILTDLTEDLHPSLADTLQDNLIRNFLQPLQNRTDILDRLMDDMAIKANV
jgi:hypothetical protein